MISIYLDAEFDAVKIHQKHEQAVISIGAVLCTEDSQEADSFYVMVRPRYFHRLTPVVKRMTQLKDIDVLQGLSLESALSKFYAWITQYEQDMSKVQLYSFGPDDRRTLVRNCRIHKIPNSLFEKIQDLQKVLSRNVMVQGRMISPTLSLDHLKLIYDVEGSVDHNALLDARDLMNCHHQALRQYPMNQVAIMNIAQQKAEKEAQVKRKQQEQLWNMLNQRFSSISKKRIHIILYPEVIDQFRLWEDRDPSFTMHWKKKGMLFQHKQYAYQDMILDMEVDIDKTTLQVTLFIVHHEIETAHTYLLSYRNATMIENILRQQEVM